MPQLHSIIEGQGPVIVLSHALGCDLHMWDEVAALLKDRYTVVRYDQRGHGQSPASAAEFSMQDLAQDAAELIAQLGCWLGFDAFMALALYSPGLGYYANERLAALPSFRPAATPHKSSR